MSSFSGKGADEQSLLRTMLDTFNRGDLVMGDAYFWSKNIAPVTTVHSHRSASHKSRFGVTGWQTGYLLN